MIAKRIVQALRAAQEQSDYGWRKPAPNTRLKSAPRANAPEGTETHEAYEGPWDTPQAQEILRRYKAKLAAFAQKSDVTFDTLQAVQHAQTSGYQDFHRHTGKTWSWVLNGLGPGGVLYSVRKYEGATAGGGQSWVYRNGVKIGQLSKFV